MFGVDDEGLWRAGFHYGWIMTYIISRYSLPHHMNSESLLVLVVGGDGL